MPLFVYLESAGLVFKTGQRERPLSAEDMSDCNLPHSNPDTRTQLLELYTRLAEEPDTDFGWGKGKENARLLGYAEQWLNRLPDCVWESAAAVGNPFSPRPVHTGETVVDIGCGSGADACVAALLVGGKGKVFGFDCVPRPWSTRPPETQSLPALHKRRFKKPR